MAGLIHLATFFDRSEVLVARSALDAAGIPSWIAHEGMLYAKPDLLLALGGYALQVIADDLTDARAILGEARIAVPQEGEEHLDSKPDYWGSALLNIVVGWFFAPGIPLPLRNRTWRRETDMPPH